MDSDALSLDVSVVVEQSRHPYSPQRLIPLHLVDHRTSILCFSRIALFFIGFTCFAQCHLLLTGFTGRVKSVVISADSVIASETLSREISAESSVAA